MNKVKIEIKNRWTGSILFEYEKENNTLKDTLEKAVEERANLGGANLEGANLEGANLGEANLGGAYLRGANLEGANLEGAYLRGAYLFVTDAEIDIENTVNIIEKNSNLIIKETYINHDIIPTRWNCFWRNGLIIREWEVKSKDIREMTIEEISKELGYEIKVVKGKNNE